jgi:hypothetical protein
MPNDLVRIPQAQMIPMERVTLAFLQGYLTLAEYRALTVAHREQRLAGKSASADRKALMDFLKTEPQQPETAAATNGEAPSGASH